MKRPFDYVNDKKIDLSLQEHRDEVLKRNKELQEVVKNGIYINDYKIKVKVIVRVEIPCFVCGTHLEEDSTEDFEDFTLNYSNFPTLKCSCCKTVYDYDLKNDRYNVNLKK